MSFTSSGSNDAAISVTWHQDYFADWSGDNPGDLEAFDALSASGIPIVNRSIYSTATTIMPFVICRDKTAERHEDLLSRWTIKTKFGTINRRANQGGAGSSEEADNQPVPIPSAVTDIEHKEYVSLGETERVLWFEKGDFPLVNTARTPAGNFWNEPVMERMPVFELKLTQYEDEITYEQMVNRKFKTNVNPWRGEPQRQWLIEQVEAQEVVVKTSTGDKEAALVTYTILLSPDQEYGWAEVRGLFDTQFLETKGDPASAKRFQNQTPGTSDVGYITTDGTKRASQSGEPDFISYVVYDEINFDDFLPA